MSSTNAAPSRCNCRLATQELTNKIPGLSPQTTLPAAKVTLDSVLQLQSDLLRHWEVVNGCNNAEDHLNHSLFRVMIDAITHVLGLYERFINLDSTVAAPARQQKQYHRASHPTEQARGTSGEKAGNGRSAPSPGPFDLDVRPPVYLGSLPLEGEDATIVMHETLRESVLRLGVTLGDIQEDSGRETQKIRKGMLEVHEDAKKAVDLLLRLLGRIPRS